MIVCLPDAQRGRYRGPRFDWSGMIIRAAHGGHVYFGEPVPEGEKDFEFCAVGPAEEFVEKGQTSYDDTPVGGTFLKVGVGLLQRDKPDPYRQLSKYPVTQPGQWQVEHGADWVQFTQDLADAHGRAYRYVKRVSLTKEPAGFVISHELHNTGSKTLDLDHYNHNFTMIDDRAIDTDVCVGLAFSPEAPQTITDGETKTIPFAEFRAGQVRFLRRPDRWILADLTGLRNTAGDYDVTFVNQATGGGLQARCDRPVTRMVFYATDRVVSAEPYISFRLAKGEKTSWDISYRFLSAGEAPQP
jgi:hypothetical protein